MFTIIVVFLSAILLMAIIQLLGVVGYFVMIAVLITDFDSPIAHAIGYTMAGMVVYLLLFVKAE